MAASSSLEPDQPAACGLWANHMYSEVPLRSLLSWDLRRCPDCLYRNPKCDECQVKDLCPEGRAMSSSKEGKRRASTKAKKAIKKETDSKSDEDFCP